jgi:hypothetical protein
MKAQVNELNQIVGIGLVTGVNTYVLPETLPSDFESEFSLYDAILEDGSITQLVKTRQAVRESDILRIARNPETFTDYKQARREIKRLVSEAGFDNLTSDEKLIACKWFAASEVQIKATIPSLQERLKAGSEFDYQSVQSRTNRLSAVKTLLYNVLTKEDGVKVIGSILKFNFETLYTKLGQEGTQSVNYKGEADEAGLYDFLQSTEEGRAAFGYVLADLGLVPLEGFTLETLVARCMDILENGNY